ncbi:MAG: hypothetical protein K1W39_12275 [Lachnospiraceae bacterium]|jgi:hypothetical protein
MPSQKGLWAGLGINIDVITGISNALYEEFGYENHMETIKQGLKEPCFFISCIKSSSSKCPGKRYKINSSFVIQYFPESKDCLAEECHNVAERMDRCLEIIKASGQLLHGQGMNYQVTDGILNYFADYSFYIRSTETVTYMESLGTSTKIKGRW